MSGSFNQQQRRAAFIQAGKQIVKNKSITFLVVYKLLIDGLNTGNLFTWLDLKMGIPGNNS
ncbi:hypothetical protein D3C81_2186490 [compost metagenome]